MAKSYKEELNIIVKIVERRKDEMCEIGDEPKAVVTAYILEPWFHRDMKLNMAKHCYPVFKRFLFSVRYS